MFFPNAAMGHGQTDSQHNPEHEPSTVLVGHQYRYTQGNLAPFQPRPGLFGSSQCKCCRAESPSGFQLEKLINFSEVAPEL